MPNLKPFSISRNVLPDTATIDPCEGPSLRSSVDPEPPGVVSGDGGRAPQRGVYLFKHNSPELCDFELHVPRVSHDEKGRVFGTRKPIRCNSWSCPSCRVIRLKYLYAMISQHCPLSEFHFLTLTLRSTRPAIRDDWFRLTKCWDVLMKRLRRKKPDLRFFRCVELTKAGMPHIHALINFKMSDHRAHDIWHDITGDSYIARFEDIRSSVAGYIIKYLDKGLSSVRNIRALTGKKTRIFQTSRGLFPIRPKIKKFDLIGFAKTKIEAINLLQEEYDQRPDRIELDGPSETYHDGGLLMSFFYTIKEIYRGKEIIHLDPLTINRESDLNDDQLEINFSKPAPG